VADQKNGCLFGISCRTEKLDRAAQSGAPLDSNERRSPRSQRSLQSSGLPALTGLRCPEFRIDPPGSPNLERPVSWICRNLKGPKEIEENSLLKAYTGTATKQEMSPI